MSEQNELDIEIITSLRKIIRAVDIFSKTLREKYGLGASHLNCLISLAEQGDMQFSKLSKIVHLSPSMITSIIDNLEEKQLVRCIPSKTDRRAINISITELGRETIANAPALLQKKMIDGLQTVQEKQKIDIIKSLDQLISLIQAEELSSAPILGSGEKLGGEETPVITRKGIVKDEKKLKKNEKKI